MFQVVLIILTFLLFYYKFLRSPDKRRFQNRDVVIITGCDSGIGLALADHLSNNNKFQVVACLLNLNKSPGHKRLESLMRQRTNLHIQKLDIRLQEDIDQLVGFIHNKKNFKEFNEVIGLVNNAGVLVFGEFDWMTWAQVENQVRVNLLGTMAITKGLVPDLIDGKGKIVNLTSVCDGIVMPGVSVYAATKAALVAFTNVLGYELDKFGVKTVIVKLADFSKLTKIMSNHESNRREMLNGMDKKKRKLYEGYFEDFQDLVQSKMGITGVESYDETSLFEDVENAIMLENPPNTILVSPLRFRMLYLILEMIPVKWIYALYRKSIQIELRA